MNLKYLILMFGVVLAGCSKPQTGDVLLHFMEQEKDVEPYPTRMIITKQYLRIDDGENASEFILFDRVNRVVYSVNDERRSVMSIHPKQVDLKPPMELKHSVKEMPVMKDAPKIDGETARHFQLYTNDKLCYDVIAVKNLLPDVVNAFSEFHSLMATDSALTFNNIPADMHDACDMSMSTFTPTRFLDFGFPIQEWGGREYMRVLIDYDQNYQADAKLFSLPAEYKRYTVQELREGKVSFAEDD